MTTLVPAARWWAPLGSRTAPTRSARAAISRRAAGLRASRVKREVSSATRPPGRVRCRDLMMKWLWMLCPPWLCRRSFSWIAPNGTLPITRSKEPSRARVSANDSLRICASGYSAAAIAR